MGTKLRLSNIIMRKLGRLWRCFFNLVSCVFTERVCFIILIVFTMFLILYGLFGPSDISYRIPHRDGAERLFLDLDYAEYLYARHIKETSAVPEGNESFASFMQSFRTEAEQLEDPDGERWLLAHILDEKTSSDHLLSSAYIAPQVRKSGQVQRAEEGYISDPKNRSCFFGRSVVSPDYAYIGFQIPNIEKSSARVYVSILASMRSRYYFATDVPGAYYKDGDRIMVYVKIPSWNIKENGENYECE